MSVSDPGFSPEKLTLPNEDPAEFRQLYNEWITAYPCTTPVEKGFLDQAVGALNEKRRIERIRATLRTDRVRTALLFFDRDQEDGVARYLQMMNDDAERAVRGLTRTAAGCRWVISKYNELLNLLHNDGTWYDDSRAWAIQLQGVSAEFFELYHSEAAYLIWLDCLAAQPNPKQADVDRLLDPQFVPTGLLQLGDGKLWPRDAAASRARLKALAERELTRWRMLEISLRVQYEEPARAEAQVMALARVNREEAHLLRAERMYEQSYLRAATALLKVRKELAASPPPAAAPVRDDGQLFPRAIDHAPSVLETAAIRRNGNPGTNGSHSGSLGQLPGTENLLFQDDIYDMNRFSPRKRSAAVPP